PPWWRAKSQLKSAVRAPPTWRCPVGLGAKRTRTGSGSDAITLDSTRGSPPHPSRKRDGGGTPEATPPARAAGYDADPSVGGVLGVGAAPARGQLGRLSKRRGQDGQGARECPRARPSDYCRGLAYGGETLPVRHQGLPVGEEPPPLAVQARTHLPAPEQGIPERIVIEHARQVRPWRQHRLEGPLDRALERPPVDLVLHPRGERHAAERPHEVPVLGGGRRVPDELDLAHVAHTQAGLVGEPDVPDRQRIEAHQAGGHRVDGNLVSAREDDVL